MTRRGIMALTLIAAATFFAFVTYRFPDLDIRLLGIGRHRYFLFHSAIVPLMALRASRRLRQMSVLGIAIAAFVVGFLAGVGAHLFTDVFQTKSVIFPFIGSLVDGTSVDDRLWEGGNAVICFGAAWKAGRFQIYGPNR